MKRNIFTLLLLVCFSFANAQTNTTSYECYITLSFSDCVNCIQPARLFTKIDKYFNAKIVFNESDKRTAKKYLEKQLNVNIDDKQIIYSDSLFLSLNKGNSMQSFVHITWKNKVIKSFRLTNFSLSDLKPFLNITLKTTKLLPPSILLGDRLVFKASSKQYFLLDQQFNQFFIFDDKYKLIHTFDKNTFSVKDIYKKIYDDTTNFYKKITRFEKALTETGKTDVTIADYYLDDVGQLFLELLIYYGDYSKDGKGVSIIPITLIVKWQKDNSKDGLFTGFKLNNPKFFNADSYYGLLTSCGFDIMEKEAYITNAHIKPDSSTVFFVSKLKTNNSKEKGFYFDKFTKLKFPTFAIKTKTDYLFVGGKLLYPFYFFNYENLVGNIETGEYLSLNNLMFTNDYQNMLNGKSKPEYYLSDIKKINKNQFLYLVQYKNKDYIYDFNSQTKKSALIREIIFPEVDYIAGPIFININTFWKINTDNELVEITF